MTGRDSFPRTIHENEALAGEWKYAVLEDDPHLDTPRAFGKNALGPGTSILGYPVSGTYVSRPERLIEALAELAADEHFWNDTYAEGWPYTFVIFMDGEEAGRAVVSFEPIPTFSADEVTLTARTSGGER
jgi:hypothetical protein